VQWNRDMIMKQDDVFAGGEGDQWFRRNRPALSPVEVLKTDPVLRVIELANLKPEKAVEIGASNGFRLHILRQLYHCEVTAVEPSEAAIAHGRTEFPEVHFVKGIASSVPIEDDAGFDLVIVNGVLVWIDRSTLLRSCAEIDRLLAQDGVLIIGDFHPPCPERVNYHHRTDVALYTYKQNYAEIFLASKLYAQFASVVFDHKDWTCHPEIVPRDRYQVCVLKKTGQEAYVAREFHPPKT
jgi:SAM-dependent methyltransferase